MFWSSIEHECRRDAGLTWHQIVTMKAEKTPD